MACHLSLSLYLHTYITYPKRREPDSNNDKTDSIHDEGQHVIVVCSKTDIRTDYLIVEVLDVHQYVLSTQQPHSIIDNIAQKLSLAVISEDIYLLVWKYCVQTDFPNTCANCIQSDLHNAATS